MLPENSEISVELLDNVPDAMTALSHERAVDYLFHRGTFETRTGNNPALILLDLRMPKVDGPEVLKAVREDETVRMTLVVILISSREERDSVEATSWELTPTLSSRLTLRSSLKLSSRSGRFGPR